MALAGLVEGAGSSPTRGPADAAGREAVEIVPTLRNAPTAGRVVVGESVTSPTGITVTRSPLMIVLFAMGPNDSGGVVCPTAAIRISHEYHMRRLLHALSPAPASHLDIGRSATLVTIQYLSGPRRPVRASEVYQIHLSTAVFQRILYAIISQDPIHLLCCVRPFCCSM